MLRYPTLLRAFRHPLILASIALLVINDHFLKYSLASPLTGKISDLAGLFFFPFLLGVLFQFASARRGLSARWALLVGMELSAAAFAAIKTLPAANEAAVTLLDMLLRPLFGLPVQIVRDPSDLLALGVLPAGWALWMRIERSRVKRSRISRSVRIESHPLSQTHSRLAYLALAAGALAALASTTCTPTARVVRLNSEGQLLYAGLLQWGAQWGDQLSSILVSQDGGKTWTGVMEHGYNDRLVPSKDAGDLAKNPFEQPVVYPKTVCSPADPQTCYRIDGSTDQVLESRDGGDTWQLAWQIPAGRVSFMQRAAQPMCDKSPDRQAFDLTFATIEDVDTLMVAMGNEGLLVHVPGSGWRRVPFDPRWTSSAPVPTPFQAYNIDDALQDTLAEGWAATSAGLLIWLGLSLWLWLRSGVAQKSVMLPLWLMTIASLLLPVPLVTLNPLAYRTIIYLLATPFLGFMLVIGLWYAGGAADQPVVARLAWAPFLTGLGVFAVSWLCFLLWAFGVLVTYELALVLAIGAGLVMLLGGIYWLRRQVTRLASQAVLANPSGEADHPE